MKLHEITLIERKRNHQNYQKVRFEFKRQEGSHMFFEHPDGRTTIIPNHPGEDVDRGLLNKIVKHDLQITREEFLKLS